MNLAAVDRYISKVITSESQTFPFPEDTKLKVGVDLGTAYIVIVVLDEKDNPIACEKRAARVLRDGVVVDYVGACSIVKELKAKLEERIGTELTECAIAMPAGTESSVKTHMYVVENSGMRVIRILDEPTAANAIYKITDGAIVDIGGGTTGLAIFKDGKVIRTEDEATGGYHLSLVLAGSMEITLDEAEQIKMNYARHQEILPVIRPVIEKMAAITKKYIDPEETKTVYLCGGTCCMTNIEKIFEKQLGITTVKATDPFLVTPTGIAVNCVPETEQ
ncbi:MAG: ethanolamine utilization protein EutJ [Firmicutes bacterium]|nr:ethanolamine utilization protein EutJ [Bacillota bacterium]